MSVASSTLRTAVTAPDYSEPPLPSYILRGHASQISALQFSLDGRLLYSGDIDGYVAVWDLSNFRPLLFWQAHEMGVLTLKDFGGGLLTHGRDNKVHHFSLPSRLASIDRASASAVPSLKSPTPLSPNWSMDVNAMAYCQLSLLRLPSMDGGDEMGLIAVPSLTKDEQIDIFHIPSQARVHRSLGLSNFSIGSKTGTLMSTTVFTVEPDSSSWEGGSGLHALAGYEDGRVALFRFTGSKTRAFEPPTFKVDDAENWDLLWEEKGHRESLMGLVLAPDQKTAWSVAADHYICRYRLFEDVDSDQNGPPRMDRFPTASPGRSAVDIRDDGKLVAVAGWDGETRLYSAKTGSPLAVLTHHRSSLHAIAFAPVSGIPSSEEEKLDSEEEEEQVLGGSGRRAWLATGGKDARISLWEMYPPMASTPIAGIEDAQ